MVPVSLEFLVEGSLSKATKGVLVTPEGRCPLPRVLICLLISLNTNAFRYPVEGHVVASPWQVQSLSAFPNHLKLSAWMAACKELSDVSFSSTVK